MDIFAGRKEFLYKIGTKVKQLIKLGYLTSKKPYRPKDEIDACKTAV